MNTIEQTRQALPTGTWELDPVHSHVAFAVEYLVGTFRGSFSPVAANLEVGEDGTATLTGTAPVENVKVQDENLTAHLLAPGFFDAERAPEIRFGSKELRRHGVTLLTKPESFLVSKDNQLLPGEEDRARIWGQQLARTVAGAAHSSKSQES